MIHTAAFKVTPMIGGAVAAALLALAAPLAWSQLAAAPAGAPTGAAATSPAPLAAPAGTAESTATTVAAKTKGLHFATGPANAQQLIADRLKRPPARWTGGDPASIKVGPVLQFWIVDGTDIIGGKSAHLYTNKNMVHEKQWQYLLLNNGAGVGVLNLIQFDGREATAGGLQEGDPDGIVPALAKLAEMKAVKEGSYEVRYLNVAEVVWDNPQIFVLWLKSDDGGKDYIYPLYPVGLSGIKDLPGWEQKLYTSEEFFKIAKPMAEEAKRILTTRPFSFNGAPQR